MFLVEFVKELNNFSVYSSDYVIEHTGYVYTYALPFERLENTRAVSMFLQRWWMHSITLAVIYFLSIRAIQWYISDRTPFVLRRPLIVWNAALTVFSIVGFVRVIEDLGYSYWTYGAYEALCFSCDPTNTAAFWSFMFLISKVVELGDTIFLLLRKKPLIFLHYYHHAAVLVYTVHSGAENTAPGLTFIAMNYFTHSLMYFYYTIRSMGYKTPRWASMVVTTVQTVQMLIGVGISVAVYQWKIIYGYQCQQSLGNLYLAFSIYVTFAALFLHFYYSAYLRKRTTLNGKKME